MEVLWLNVLPSVLLSHHPAAALRLRQHAPAWSDMLAAGLDLSDGYRWVGTVGSNFNAAWRVSNINITSGKAFNRTQHGYVDSSSRGHAHSLVPWKPLCCQMQLLCLAPLIG